MSCRFPKSAASGGSLSLVVCVHVVLAALAGLPVADNSFLVYQAHTFTERESGFAGSASSGRLVSFLSFSLSLSLSATYDEK